MGEGGTGRGPASRGVAGARFSVLWPRAPRRCRPGASAVGQSGVGEPTAPTTAVPTPSPRPPAVPDTAAPPQRSPAAVDPLELTE